MTSLSQESLEKITSSLTTLVELLKEKPVKEEIKTEPVKEEIKTELVKEETKPELINSMKLFDAIYQNNIVKLKELIEAKADVNIQNQWGKTPLHYVTTEKLMKLLLDAGANINHQNNNYSYTPLHSACYKPEIIKLLLEAGADYTIKNKNGLTPKEYYEFKCQHSLKIIDEFIKKQDQKNKIKEYLKLKDNFTKEEITKLFENLLN